MYIELLKDYFLREIAFTPSELEKIVSAYYTKQVAKGDYLLRRGAVCHFEGYVAEGCFKVSLPDAQGVEKVLYFAARDWWVTEIDSFANRSPSSLNIQALKDSTVLLITREEKEKLYREVPRVERFFRMMYQKAVTAWQRRLIRNHTMMADERYHHFIDTYPEIDQLVTNKLIASYLGITQEFLSMIRKRRSIMKD